MMLIARLLFGLAAFLLLVSWLLPKLVAFWDRRHEMRAMAKQPEPPQNVRIRYPDGTEYPVELIYRGQDQRGFHVWHAVPTAPALSHDDLFEGVQVLVDVLPAMTSVMLRGR